MPTLPPRSLSPIDSCGHRVLRLPNGNGTRLLSGWGWPGDGDPLDYVGWAWEAHDPTQAEISDLTDDEIREICGAPADKREDVIARIAATRKERVLRVPHDRTWTLTIPDADGDRALTGPDGSWRWLFAPSTRANCETSDIWPPSIGHDDLAIVLHLTEEEALSLLPAKGRNARIEQIRASRATEKILEKWAPTCSPAFAESLRAQGLGAREPVWEEPEDLVREPPHYRLPGDRETLEDVIAPICDALSERRLPGSTIYMVGNALKYLSRLGAKGSPLEDLRKAREYLDRAIARMTAE